MPMRQRKRFKRTIIVSSDNYVASKLAHIKYLYECHTNNIPIIEEINKRIITEKRAFVWCINKYIPITLEKAHEMESYTKILYI